MFCFTLSPKVYHTVYINFLLKNKQKKNGVKYRFLPLGGMEWKMSGQTGKWFERLLGKDEQGVTCKNITYLSIFLLLRRKWFERLLDKDEQGDTCKNITYLFFPLLLLSNTRYCWHHWCTLHVARRNFKNMLS